MNPNNYIRAFSDVLTWEGKMIKTFNSLCRYERQNLRELWLGGSEFPPNDAKEIAVDLFQDYLEEDYRHCLSADSVRKFLDSNIK